MKTNVILVAALLLAGACSVNKERFFISKYGNEDFSQFVGVNMYYRAEDPGENTVILGSAPVFSSGSAEKYSFAIVMRRDYVVESLIWNSEDIIKMQADTIRLTQLMETFVNYGILRLDVKADSTAYVYLFDVNKPTLVRKPYSDWQKLK